jgi:hypothetical protein
MSRSLARLVAFAAALCALALAFAPRIARAQGEPAAAIPRDVGIVVQPSAARLPRLPDDFVRLDQGWLVLELPASVRDRAETLARDAEDFRARLAADLGQPVLDHALVRIARSPEQMAELAPEGAGVPSYAAGVAYPSVHLALLALQAPGTWEAPDLVELLRHELTHLALADAVAGQHVPRWFDEGLAIFESGEGRWSRFRVLWDATLSGRLLPLADLDRSFPEDRYEVSVAYAESADFVQYLMRDADRARYGSLIQRVRNGGAFTRALEDAYGTDVPRLEYEWREERARHFGVTPLLTGSGLLWVAVVGLAAVAWLKRRRRARAKLEQWAREEAQADAALVAARAEPSALPEPPLDDSMPPPVGSGVPVVEHEGRWYTLH